MRSYIGLLCIIVAVSVAVEGGLLQRWDCVAFDTGWRNNPTAEIYVVNLDGSGLTRLTNNNIADYSPAFSPDGMKIAFISWRDGDGAGYVMNADGSDQRRLSMPNPHPRDYEDMWPTFTPDGKRIAALRTYYPPADTVFFPVNGDSEEFFDVGDCNGLVGDAGGAYGVAFSPDRRNVAFSLDIQEGDLASELWLANADGSGAHRLTKDSAHSYSFSPDGKQIVYSLWTEKERQIFTINVDGSGHRQLTNDDRDNHSPMLSPDGKQIIYVSGTHSSEPPGLDMIASHIYVMNADGSGNRMLRESDLGEESPCFTPDGTGIVFAAGPIVNGYIADADIYVMNSDGTQLHRIIDGEGGFSLGPSLVSGRLVDSYGNWHEVAK